MKDFKAMLAKDAPPAEFIRYPVMASPKLDGIRFHIINGRVLSRNLLPFKNNELQAKWGREEYNGLDGEIMCGDPTNPKAFRKAAVVNSHNGNISEVRFYVFDDFTNPNDLFRNRLARAHNRAKDRKLFIPVKHELISDPQELQAYEAACLTQGYEGVMIRDPKGIYKYGRATVREGLLLKVKQFHDSEAVIDDAEELMHNANEKTLVSNGKAKRNTKKEGKIPRGVLGSLVVRDIHTGVAFNIGSGFTATERSGLWTDHGYGNLVGRVVKYRYFPTGSKDKPRFPVFHGFRDPNDL